MAQIDSFKTRTKLPVGGIPYDIFSLKTLQAQFAAVARLPFSLKVLLENLLRYEDGRVVKKDHVDALVNWNPRSDPDTEISFTPARVLLQDFTGVPVVVDLAAMREALASMGGNPQKVNPLCPLDLVIDHSVMVDKFGTRTAFQENVDIEFERNTERYAFLKWGQKSLKNFRAVPPGTGICHQVNLEYLAQGVFKSARRRGLPRLAGRHRLAHHHDQRPGRGGLGRGRHRGRGGHARPAHHHAHSPGGRLQADRQAGGRRDGDRPGAHRHPDAAQEGRGGQVRRVLRPGHRARCR